MPKGFCYSHRPREGPQLFQDGVETGDPESCGPWSLVPADPDKGPQLLRDGVRTGELEGTQSQLTLAQPSIKGFQKNGCLRQANRRALLKLWIGGMGKLRHR